MSFKSFKKTNFFKNTFAVFIETTAPSNTNTATWNFKSKYQSAYYYTKEGVYRYSDHWGRVGTCRWLLKTEKKLVISREKNRKKIGFASWESFYKTSSSDKAYFIEVNYLEKSVNYQHYSLKKEGETVILRTPQATQKIIKKIKPILQSDAWQKYHPDCEDFEALRKEKIKLLLELV